MHKKTVTVAKQLCRRLRKEQTRAETILWEQLRNRKYDNQKFLRQHPIFFIDPSGKECFYIADFYCHARRLILELDGGIHFYQYQADKERTNIIEGMGYTILRFRNEVIETNYSDVFDQLRNVLK